MAQESEDRGRDEGSLSRRALLGAAAGFGVGVALRNRWAAGAAPVGALYAAVRQDPTGTPVGARLSACSYISSGG